MAISKHQRRPKRPDAAVFTRLIDEGLAEPAVVSRAYQTALREWKNGMTYAQILAMASADVGVVANRSDIDDDQEEPTPEPRLIALDRAALLEEEA